MTLAQVVTCLLCPLGMVVVVTLDLRRSNR